MIKTFLKGAALLAVALAAPGQAAVTYLYSATSVYFQFTIDDYLQAGDSFTPADLNFCETNWAGYVCESVSASTGTDPIWSTPTEIISYKAINYATNDSITVHAYWTPGRFSTPGAWTANHSSLGDPTTLHVAGSPTPAVPELATWAMMIAGFAMAGWHLRRRRTAVAFG